MNNICKSFSTICIILTIVFASFAQTKTEDDYYKIVTLPMPPEIIMEVGGLVSMPDGKLAVSTRRGEVWLVENPSLINNNPPRYTKYAEGLHEILGLAYKDGLLYCAQRGELTRLIDYDHNGKADAFEVVASWPLSGNYHEFSFGPKIDKDGNFIITTNIGFDPSKWWLARSYVPYRGFMLKISPDGKITPVASGLRSPCGIYVHENNDYFYSENQGDWVGSGGITHIERGNFVGNPASLVWASLPDNPVKLTINDIATMLEFDKNYMEVAELSELKRKKATLYELSKKNKAIKPQAITLPHSVMGQSTSDMLQNNSDIEFAPFFDNQIFIGDQAQSKIMRLYLEKVKGVYQGAAFDFKKGFASGVLRMAWGKQNDMYIGGTGRGWESSGGKPFSLQKLVWTGDIPFEMKTVKAKPDGFEIEFIKPVKKSAENINNYKVTSFTYLYHPNYGSPIIRDTIRKVQAAVLASDNKTVRIVVNKLSEGYIHEIKLQNITSVSDEPLLHNAAYYTLNVIPDGDKVQVTAAMAHAGHSMGDMKQPAKAEKPVAQPAKPAKANSSAKNQTTMPATWVGKADKTILLGTKPGLLYYDQDKIKVKAKQKIKLTFTNTDDMLHNVVIVNPGKGDVIGEISNNMGLEGPKMHYVPASADVLYHTKLVGPGSNESIYFVAPATPGEYTIVCTYPGHYATMQALLIVE
ncbi:MAG: plastocyanin/azurin family copper-binding protein [Cytophagales bacterium]|nr:plastocyanin/azurin family copper-binding protein [Cytophagales bacterium]